MDLFEYQGKEFFAECVVQKLRALPKGRSYNRLTDSDMKAQNEIS